MKNQQRIYHNFFFWILVRKFLNDKNFRNWVYEFHPKPYKELSLRRYSTCQLPHLTRLIWSFLTQRVGWFICIRSFFSENSANRLLKKKKNVSGVSKTELVISAISKSVNFSLVGPKDGAVVSPKNLFYFWIILQQSQPFPVLENS